MSSNKSNKWKKVGGRSRSANYNAVRIPQQTANIFNISDLMGKASTDNSTLGKINIHDNVAIQGTLDVSGSASGITSTKPSGNEFATLDWVIGELNPTALWTLHENGNIIYNKNGSQVDIIGNTYNEGTSTFNGSLQVLSPFIKETSFFGLTNDTQDQSQPPNFGSSVAISSIISGGDPSYNIAVTSAQQAEVYYTDPLDNTGTLGAKIDKNNDINFNNAPMGFNGSNQCIAISADGKVVVVGDPSNNRIYISESNDNGVFENSTINPDNYNILYNSDSRFGYSVAVCSNDYGYSIAVGAPYFKNENGVEVGQVYVWKSVNTGIAYKNAWTPISNDIIGDNGGNNELIPHMGISVAFNNNGRLLAVGSGMDGTVSDINGTTQQGQVDVYKYTSNSNSNVNWLKLPKSLKANSFSQIGHSLSISDDGTILAVGAPGTYTQLGYEDGNVYIYQIEGITASQIADVNYQSVSNVTWTQIKTIPGKPHSSFGTSVSLNLAGNTLVAGGPTYNGSVNGTGQGTGQGYVEVYTYVHSDWRLACPTIYQEFPNDGRTYIPNTSARFGSSVSISSNDSSNNMIVVGAPYNKIITDGNSSVTGDNFGTIFTYTLNDIRSSMFTVDSGNNTSSFKGQVYIDRSGVTGDPIGNEVVTAGWVTSQLTNAQQLISQQGLTIDTMKSSSSLTASDQTKISKLEKKIDITQQMINYHAQNVTNIKLNATSKMAIDELARKLNDVQEVIDKQNEDIYKMSLQTRSNEECIFNYEMKYNDTMKQQSNLINDTQMRIRSQEKQVKGLCRNVNSHTTNIQSMKQLIQSGGSSGPTIPK
jgi:hypothetical protein